MKIQIPGHLLLALCAFGFLPQKTVAQTTLALGDIAFTGYTCTSSPDEFSFVILKSTGITSGTTITFTDIAWFSGTCGTNGWATNLNSLTSGVVSNCSSGTETEITWTSGSSVSYGTHVKISGTTASNGSVSGTALAFPSTGDQIYAIQGSRTGTYTMLTAIHANKYTGTPATSDASGWDNITSGNFASCNDNWGNKPTCLTNGTNCIWMLDGSSNEVDNGVYNCTGSNSNTSGAAITAQRTAINNISNWTTQNTTGLTLPPSGCSPLPVTWLFFYANMTEYGAKVEWATASEINASHFEIQRSFNATDWETVGSVKGHGTKMNLSEYAFDDRFDAGDLKFVFYRIRQVDYDQKFEFTPIITAKENRSKNGYTAFEFNGNPFTQASYIRTFLPNASEVIFEISDANGRIVYNKTHNYTGGYNRFHFWAETPEVMSTPGIYYIRASFKDETKVFKLLVQ